MIVVAAKITACACKSDCHWATLPSMDNHLPPFVSARLVHQLRSIFATAVGIGFRLDAAARLAGSYRYTLLLRPVDVSEAQHAGASPQGDVQRVALEKAQVGWRSSKHALPVLSADTMVQLN